MFTKKTVPIVVAVLFVGAVVFAIARIGSRPDTAAMAVQTNEPNPTPTVSGPMKAAKDEPEMQQTKTESPVVTPDMNSQTAGMAASMAKKNESRSDEVFDGIEVVRTAAEWKRILTREQFYVLREKGTEQAYTGKYTDNHAPGDYHCAACGLKLFRSSAKFDSGTGWPSFFKPANKKNVAEEVDNSLDEIRTEVLCSRCKGHLGHVFDDGPEPTGLRYCINSVALRFVKR